MDDVQHEQHQDSEIEALKHRLDQLETKQDGQRQAWLLMQTMFHGMAQHCEKRLAELDDHTEPKAVDASRRTFLIRLPEEVEQSAPDEHFFLPIQTIQNEARPVLYFPNPETGDLHRVLIPDLGLDQVTSFIRDRGYDNHRSMVEVVISERSTEGDPSHGQ